MNITITLIILKIPVGLKGREAKNFVFEWLQGKYAFVLRVELSTLKTPVDDIVNL